MYVRRRTNTECRAQPATPVLYPLFVGVCLRVRMYTYIHSSYLNHPTLRRFMKAPRRTYTHPRSNYMMLVEYSEVLVTALCLGGADVVLIYIYEFARVPCLQLIRNEKEGALDCCKGAAPRRFCYGSFVLSMCTIHTYIVCRLKERKDRIRNVAFSTAGCARPYSVASQSSRHR